MAKTYLITGATSGIGKMTAIAAAKADAKNVVIFNARNLAKGEEVRKEITAETGNENIFCFEGDFESLASVKKFAENVAEKFPVIDVLLNNAGTWEMQFKESKDGFECNFAVNHIAPFLLTLLLLPALQKSASGRIINTSSGAHRRNILQFDDLEFRKGTYNGFFSYSQSKLCNLLFSLQLEKELQKQNVQNITVNSLHPGLVKTALFDKMNKDELALFGSFVTPEEGAMTSIFLTLSDTVEGISGKYWHKHTPAETSPLASNEVAAQKLWDESMHRVGKFLA